MRSILRAAGRMARGLLWIVKGLLLILAVVTLVLWPMSRGKTLSGSGAKWTVWRERVDAFDIGIEISDGRIFAWHNFHHFLGGDALNFGRESAAQDGGEWKWNTPGVYGVEISDAAPSGWGPLRWKSETMRNPNYGEEHRSIAISCWLLAPLLALCPLVSFAFFIRRRTRRRRRLATNRCLSCGYDLRATPLAGGETLSRCPECGADDQTPASRGAKPKGEDR